MTQHQPNWHFCIKCSNMQFDSGVPGVCLGVGPGNNGPTDHQSQGFNFSLPFDRGETAVHEVKDSSFNYFHLFPDQLGLRTPSLHELRGGDAEQNANTLTAILSGIERGAKRDFVLINAAAGLVIAGLATRMEKGLQLAAQLVDSGHALAKLHEFQAFFR